MVDMWVGTTAHLLFLPKPRAQVDIVSSLRRFFKFGTSTVSPFQEWETSRDGSSGYPRLGVRYGKLMIHSSDTHYCSISAHFVKNRYRNTFSLGFSTVNDFFTCSLFKLSVKRRRRETKLGTSLEPPVETQKLTHFTTQPSRGRMVTTSEFRRSLQWFPARIGVPTSTFLSSTLMRDWVA